MRAFLYNVDNFEIFVMFVWNLGWTRKREREKEKNAVVVNFTQLIGYLMKLLCENI